ncbi:MAG: AAA family ATPase [Proteobacteria bacterium]|nr:AAA family ATPase [Pseudomonadota bacterium]
MIIHLNGMPGVGKLTVAKILAADLPARLIDNHRLIDTVTVCCDRGSLMYIETLLKLTKVVYEVLETLQKKEIFVFTNALSAELSEDRERFNAVQTLADRRGVPFVPTLLTCTLEENKQRLVDPARASKGKLMDIENLASLYEKYTIYHPTTHHNAIVINTTGLKPAQVADRIAQHIKDIQ